MQRREHVGDRAREHTDPLVVVCDLGGLPVEVRAPDLERAERQRARGCAFASDRERHRVVDGEHERRAGPKDTVHLAEEPVDVLDFAEHACGEREVDRVGAQEREVGGVALVPLDPHLGRVGELASQRELCGRAIERDDVRAVAS